MTKELAKRQAETALVDSWIGALTAKRSPATLTTYRRGVARFIEWLQANGETATPEAVERWKAELLTDKEKPLKPTTVNTWLTAVRRFFAWAVAAGYLPENPLEEVKNVERKGANKGHLRDKLDDSEIRAVLALPDRSTPIGKRDYALLCLKAYTGMRDVEIHRANREDLHKAKGLPVLRIQGKGRIEKNRVAIIYHEQAQEAMFDWLEERGKKAGPLFVSYSDRSAGERLTLRAIRHIVKRYLRLAGIDDPLKTSHSFRHSAITKAAGENAIQAQQMAGHTNLATTLIYFHESERTKAPAERFIRYDDED